jgi:hypothetical protein
VHAVDGGVFGSSTVDEGSRKLEGPGHRHASIHRTRRAVRDVLAAYHLAAAGFIDSYDGTGAG